MESALIKKVKADSFISMIEITLQYGVTKMPMVNGKKYPYTKKGKAMAAKAKKKKKKGK